MMWHEFEMIAGYSVTQQDYEEYIEPMYMALGGEVTKQDFVQMVNKKRFAIPDPAAILREVRKEARRHKALCGQVCSRSLLSERAELYAVRKFGMGAEVYFEDGYGYPEAKMCPYPDVLVITCDGMELERVKLQR